MKKLKWENDTNAIVALTRTGRVWSIQKTKSGEYILYILNIKWQKIAVFKKQKSAKEVARLIEFG